MNRRVRACRLGRYEIRGKRLRTHEAKAGAETGRRGNREGEDG